MGKFYAKKLVKGDKKYHVVSDVPQLYRESTKQALTDMYENGEIDKETYYRLMEIEEVEE